MARTPELVHIGLHELMLLLNYRWAAVNSEIGDLGDTSHEGFVADLDRQSTVKIKPTQLADLIHHMREVIFEKVHPKKIDLRVKNHNEIMKMLRAQNPDMFKVLSSGEVVMVNYEDRANV